MILESLLNRLLIASLAIVPGLLAALAVTRYAPLSTRAQAWTLRLALLGPLLALAGLGPKINLPTTPGEDAPNLLAMSLLVGTYAAGALTHLSDFAKSLRTIRALRRTAQPIDFQIVSEVAHLAGLRKPPQTLRATTGESVLLVAGRPLAILLPARDVDPATLRLALAHEMAHIRHRDLLWSAVAAIAETFLWFHPLVRLTAKRLASAQESAADQATLATLNAPTKEYAEMLIGLATARRDVPTLGATAASVREEVEERVRGLYGRPSAPWGLALAVLAATIALIPVQPGATKPSLPQAPVPVSAPVAAPAFSP